MQLFVLAEPALKALGLTKIAPRRWIDGSNPPARRLFELQLLKGDGIIASWGFSLDTLFHILPGEKFAGIAPTRQRSLMFLFLRRS